MDKVLPGFIGMAIPDLIRDLSVRFWSRLRGRDGAEGNSLFRHSAVIPWLDQGMTGWGKGPFQGCGGCSGVDPGILVSRTPRKKYSPTKTTVVIPASCGDPHPSLPNRELSVQVLIEVPPIWIGRFDRLNLPGPRPAFRALFAPDGVFGCFKDLIVNQPGHVIATGEAFGLFFAVLMKRRARLLVTPV